MPTIDAIVTIRPQIIFFQKNYFDEICSTLTYVANAIYPVPSFLDLSECCHNFINQDLTFLQPSTVYEMTVSENSLSTASDSTDASVITVKENNPSQEVDSNSSLTSVTALSDDPVNIDYSLTPIQPIEPAPIQPVEPVIGLTTDGQR